MICPSCKGENPAHAVRCGHCGAGLDAPKVSNAVESSTAGAPLDSKDKPKLPSGSRPSSHADLQDDRTIDSATPSGVSRSKDGPGVSILSKTPSGSIPMDDRTMDSAVPSALGETGSPAADTRPSTRSRAGGGL